MEHHKRNPILLLSLGVAALFLLGFLLLVAFGARSYRDIVDSQYANMDGRGLTAYIVSSVKANDSAGSVSIEDSEYGQVLVVTDSMTGYALRYYRYDSQLVEDFARAGSPLFPDAAQAIAPTSRFSVERIGEDLLSITTDAGRTLLSIRSGEEAAP